MPPRRTSARLRPPVHEGAGADPCARLPYDAYFAGGTLYLSPDFQRDFPQAADLLAACAGADEVPVDRLPPRAAERLAACGVTCQENGRTVWISSVHAPRRLDRVCPMAAGDWYR